MDNSLARFLLEGWMPGDASEQDPQVRAALAHARLDPELSAWLARKVRLDTRLAAEVAAFEPPAGLRATLLAGMAASQAPRRRRSRLRSVLAWAACFAVITTLVGAGWWRFGNPPRLRGHDAPALVAETLRYSMRGPRLAYTHTSALAVQSWLGEAGLALPARLPAELAALPTFGCSVLDFAGHPVALICFRGDRPYHLYIAPRALFPDREFAGEPSFAATGDWSMATWADERFVYVLNGRGDPAGMRFRPARG